MRDSNKYQDHKDLIDELDIIPLPQKDADFIASLIEHPPSKLSPKQLGWLRDLERNYLL